MGEASWAFIRRASQVCHMTMFPSVPLTLGGCQVDSARDTAMVRIVVMFSSFPLMTYAPHCKAAILLWEVPSIYIMEQTGICGLTQQLLWNV